MPSLVDSHPSLGTVLTWNMFFEIAELVVDVRVLPPVVHVDSRRVVFTDLAAPFFFNDEVTREGPCFARVIATFAGIPENIFQHVFRFGVCSQ